MYCIYTEISFEGFACTEKFKSILLLSFAFIISSFPITSLTGMKGTMAQTVRLHTKMKPILFVVTCCKVMSVWAN